MDCLINKIKILKENSDYRITDVVLKKAGRWKHSGNNILRLDKYKNTILRKYLEINTLERKHNLNLLLKLIIKYIKKNKIKMPNKNEIVLHLRLGDVCVHKWFLSKNYVKLIKNIIKKNRKIKKITIICCFAYQVFTDDSIHLKRKTENLWDYTEYKQQKNLKKMKEILGKIKRNFRHIQINVYSNENVDLDLCYAVGARYFIKDNGGFSNLMNRLNLLNKKLFLKYKLVKKLRKMYY